MSRKTKNARFKCVNCDREILPVTNGSFRNHCPFCLHSVHVDDLPGDRSSSCGGLMEPVGLIYKGAKGYQIIHRCCECKKKQPNIVAEGTIQPDSLERLIKLSQMN